MTSQIRSDNAEMEYLTAPFKMSRIALGTWAIGGWMWGGTNEDESIRTIHAALDRGINLIDTARFTDLAAPRSLSARPLPSTAAASRPSSRPKSVWPGRTALPTETPAKAGSSRRLRNRCGVCKRTSSTSTRSIGRTLTRRSSKPRKRWRRSFVQAKSARSA